MSRFSLANLARDWDSHVDKMKRFKVVRVDVDVQEEETLNRVFRTAKKLALYTSLSLGDAIGGEEGCVDVAIHVKTAHSLLLKSLSPRIKTLYVHSRSKQGFGCSFTHVKTLRLNLPEIDLDLLGGSSVHTLALHTHLLRSTAWGLPSTLKKIDLSVHDVDANFQPFFRGDYEKFEMFVHGFRTEKLLLDLRAKEIVVQNPNKAFGEPAVLLTMQSKRLAINEMDVCFDNTIVHLRTESLRVFQDPFVTVQPGVYKRNAILAARNTNLRNLRFKSSSGSYANWLFAAIRWTQALPFCEELLRKIALFLDPEIPSDLFGITLQEVKRLRTS